MAAQIRITLGDEAAAALDERRGPATRTAYVMWVVRRELSGQRRTPPTRSEASTSAAGDRAERQCPHPPARVLKGLCGACGTRP